MLKQTLIVLMTAGAVMADYELVDLGIPDGADSVIGVRMNNLGQVAGWSIFYGQEPALRGWVWTPDEGFDMLPSPPDTYDGRFRAIDISDSGIVAGDGGFDIGPAWRYENGEYTIIEPLGGMFIGVMGGVNEHGDLAGWFKDATIVTPDIAFSAVNGGETIEVSSSGRGVDINDAGQVTGYSGGLGAFLWSQDDGMQSLGALDLSYSFATRMNELGHVVGYAKSANGNTSKAWIYTEAGQQLIPGIYENSSRAVAINDSDVVVGMTGVGGPDLPWLWTADDGVVPLHDLFNFPANGLSAPVVVDINDEGMILVRVFDNNVVDYRMVILMPTGACDADFNGDGSLDILDFVAFQNAFTAGDTSADCDADGALTILDFICFQNAFTAGCG